MTQTTTKSKDHDRTGLETTCLAKVQPKPVCWLVKDYIPLGKLTIWAADGGVGKSSVARDLIAHVTRGRPAFGLAYTPHPAADALLIGVEDGLDDTVLPSLLAAGADVNRVHHVKAALDKTGKPKPFTAECVEELKAYLQAQPPVKLVVIDPITAYVGRAGLDDHRTAVVQAVLGALAEVAEAQNVALILIIHFNKGQAANAVNRVVSSKAYTNTARNNWVMLPDPEEPERRLFLPIKRNLPGSPKGLAFHREPLTGEEQHHTLASFTKLTHEQLTELGAQLTRLVWDGEVDVSADQVLRESMPGGQHIGAVEACMKWLMDFAGKQAYPTKEILAEARKMGFTFEAQKEAKTRLIQTEGFQSKPLEANGEWWFGKGPKDTWTRRPNPN